MVFGRGVEARREIEGYSKGAILVFNCFRVHVPRFYCGDWITFMMELNYTPRWQKFQLASMGRFTASSLINVL